ncbi:MAG: hypothetical protein ACRENE_09855 [Polyangiaceae bacterium]
MFRLSQPVVLAVACVVIAVVSSTGGCSSKSSGTFDQVSGSGSSSSAGTSSGSSGDDSGGTSSGNPGSSGFNFGGSSGSGGSTGSACGNNMTGWCGKVDTSCGTSTSLTGKVYDPAVKNPIYDVVVFIPNDETTLPKITQGTHSCSSCDTPIGNYVSAVTTNIDGTFTLSPVPTGSNVPVVVQIGKWRRITHVNIPTSCKANAVADKTLHLPGAKSEGDMPQMALLTGGCDDMSCFLLNVGIKSSEFNAPHAGGRVDVYQGNGLGGVPGPNLDTAIGTGGNCTTTSCPLWASRAAFEAYDMAILSCQCGEQTNNSETPAGYAALHDWVNEGGKVFASHYNYTWFKNSADPKWVATATWLGSSIAAGSGTFDVDTTFPKGVPFGKWLGVTGALTAAGPPPTIMVSSVANSVSTINTATTLRWIYDPSTSPADTKYLSFNTPIGGTAQSTDAGESGKQYCGKAVFTDLHTSAGLIATAPNVPTDCKAADLSPQQKALEYLFFDLAACVVDDMAPMPKIIPPPM